MVMVPIDHDPKKNPIVSCKLCGKDEVCVWNEECNAKLVKNSTCFTCDYWEDSAERLARSVGKPFPTAVVVHNKEDGGPMVYFVAAELPQFRGLMRGYGGSKFIIEFDDGRKMASSNLWSGQKIPTLWGKDPRFQPTATLRHGYPEDREAFLKEFDSLIVSGAFLTDEEEES